MGTISPIQNTSTKGLSMTNLIATVIGVYIVFVAALYVFQRNLMYHPDSMVPSPAASGVARSVPSGVRG